MAPPAICNTFLLVNVTAVGILLAMPGDAVPRSDIVFVTCTLLYAFVANAVAEKPSAVTARRTLSPSPAVLRLFFPCTISLSLAAPWVLLLSRRAPAALLAPHLFVMHAQLAAETFTYSLSLPPNNFVSLYVRVALPIVFVAYRLPIIFSWWKAARGLPEYAQLVSALALANGAFWSTMFFGFLLPFVLTRNFKVPPSETASQVSPEKIQ